MNEFVTVTVERFEELIRDSQTLEAINAIVSESEYIRDADLRNVLKCRKEVKVNESV